MNNSSLLPWENALLDFMKIYSPTGEEARAGTFLLNLLRHIFPNATLTTHEAAPNRFNVYCHIPNPNGHTPLILTSHFDTVSVDIPVYHDAENLYGRGACDAKGQIIAQIWGAKRIIEEGGNGIALCFVVGEETDGIGARTLLGHMPNAQYLLNGEPTGNRFVSLSWGAIDVILTTKGTAQHSSLGTSDSATHKLIADLHSLLAINQDSISINVGIISGGTTPNTTADLATGRMCIRYSIKTDQVHEVIKASVKYSEIEFVPPLTPLSLYVPASHQRESIEVRFGSDCSIFKDAVPHVMLRGPGDIAHAHTPHEHINRAQLAEAIEEIAHLARWASAS